MESEVNGSDNSSPSRWAGKSAAALLLVIAAFQLALALGAPWGQAAWGGSNPGVLPVGLRIASAFAVPVYVAIAAVASGRLLHGNWARRVLVGAAALIGLGVLANAASPSMLEKLIWTPVTLALAFLLWRASREVRTPPQPPLR